MNDYPLVLVEWNDASRLNDSWMDWDDIPEPYTHKCITVGYLAKKNKTAIILIPTIGDTEHKENRHTYGGMMIPRSAIISEKVLK